MRTIHNMQQVPIHETLNLQTDGFLGADILTSILVLFFI